MRSVLSMNFLWLLPMFLVLKKEHKFLRIVYDQEVLKKSTSLESLKKFYSAF